MQEHVAHFCFKKTRVAQARIEANTQSKKERPNRMGLKCVSRGVEMRREYYLI